MVEHDVDQRKLKLDRLQSIRRAQEASRRLAATLAGQGILTDASSFDVWNHLEGATKSGFTTAYWSAASQDAEQRLVEEAIAFHKSDSIFLVVDHEAHLPAAIVLLSIEEASKAVNILGAASEPKLVEVAPGATRITAFESLQDLSAGVLESAFSHEEFLADEIVGHAVAWEKLDYQQIAFLALHAGEPLSVITQERMMASIDHERVYLAAYKELIKSGAETFQLSTFNETQNTALESVDLKEQLKIRSPLFVMSMDVRPQLTMLIQLNAGKLVYQVKHSLSSSLDESGWFPERWRPWNHLFPESQIQPLSDS